MPKELLPLVKAGFAEKDIKLIETNTNKHIMVFTRLDISLFLPHYLNQNIA
jgi:hypothetical protein